MITALGLVLYGLGVSLLVLLTLLAFDYEPNYDDLFWYDRLALAAVAPMCFILSTFEGWDALRDELALFYEMVILGHVADDE